MSMDQAWPYRSPVAKLLRFFWRSRDQWKAKCKAAKRENKSLKQRLLKMKESRDRWKAQAKGSVMDQDVEVPPSPDEPKQGPLRSPRRATPRGAI